MKPHDYRLCINQIARYAALHVMMDKAKRLFRRRDSYEPLSNDSDTETLRPSSPSATKSREFSWIEYGVFLLLGVAMLWAWYVTPFEAFSRLDITDAHQHIP